MITVYPNPLRHNATALLTFRGAPFMPVQWSLTGAGTLSSIDWRTDSRGIAKAVFTPSSPDQVATVEVSYGD